MYIETDAKCTVFVAKIKQDIEDLHGKSANEKGRKSVLYTSLRVQGQGKAAVRKVAAMTVEDAAITEPVSE
jgi:hypothetical protein